MCAESQFEKILSRGKTRNPVRASLYRQENVDRCSLPSSQQFMMRGGKEIHEFGRSRRFLGLFPCKEGINPLLARAQCIRRPSENAHFSGFTRYVTQLLPMNLNYLLFHSQQSKSRKERSSINVNLSSFLSHAFQNIIIFNWAFGCVALTFCVSRIITPLTPFKIYILGFPILFLHRAYTSANAA
jgi:hypothetical protein